MNVQLNTMEIQLESRNPHAIQSYSEHHVVVDGIEYEQSLFISNEGVKLWSVHSLTELDETTLTPCLDYHPEVVLIGHQTSGVYLSPHVISFLSQHRIGVECMSIGAASRTFNLLLSEGRRVMVGIIL